MALRFLLRFPAFSQKEQNGPFFTFSWLFQTFLPALQNATVEVNVVVPHGDTYGDGGAPDLNGPLHGFKDG